MKLIQKTNRNFIVLVLILVPIAIISIFFLLNYFIQNEVDEKLRVDEKRIIEQIMSGASIKSLEPIYEIRIINSNAKEGSKIKNTEVYDPIEKEKEPFRELSSIKKINNQNFSIVVRQATIESDDLLNVIIYSIAGIFFVFILLIYFLNARVSKNIWKPFHFNLKQLQDFSLQSGNKIQLRASTIDEFNDLNTSLVQMTNKMDRDYQILKEFTENASHEIQTPLSIISLNLEEIVQDNLPEKTLSKVYSVYQSVQRLSKLNEKLLLLAKLDNQQFSANHSISLNDVLKQQLEDFQPVFENEEITLTAFIDDVFNVDLDEYLATILITNLLSNAVKYNLKKGNISVKVNSQNIVISNTTNESIDCALIFERFKKGSATIESTGLGLAIVQKIADLGQLQISASLNSGIFQIKISK